MSESFYNQAPIKNARYARKLAKESHEEISEFLREYRHAIEKNERRAYESSNERRDERRDEIVSLRERIAAEIDLVPLDCQGTVAKVMTRVDETLNSCPTFPPPILNNPAAIGKTQAVVGNNPNKTKMTISF